MYRCGASDLLLSHRHVEAWVVRSRMPAVADRLTERHLRVIGYHEAMDAAALGDQLDYLQEHYQPVSIGDVLNAFEGGRNLPRRAVLITFDDGDRSVADIAAPLLAERDIPAVAYVIAGLLDTQNPLWWNEVTHHVLAGGVTQYASGTAREVVRALKHVHDTVRRLAIAELRQSSHIPVPATPQLLSSELRGLEEAGVAIGNHSWSHPCLEQCENELIADEIRRSHLLLSDACGHPISTFAYPNGSSDHRVRAALQEAGYKVAFLFDHSLTSVPVRDPLAVSRLDIDATANVDRLRFVLSGLHPALRHAVKRPA